MLDDVLKLAKEQDAVKVTEISVQVGELTFVTAEQLGYAFEFVSKNTIAEGAKLIVEIEQAEIKCNTCGFVGEAHYHGPEIHESSVAQRIFIDCPKCGSNLTELVRGSEFFLKSVKFEK